MRRIALFMLGFAWLISNSNAREAPIELQLYLFTSEMSPEYRQSAHRYHLGAEFFVEVLRRDCPNVPADLIVVPEPITIASVPGDVSFEKPQEVDSTFPFSYEGQSTLLHILDTFGEELDRKEQPEVSIMVVGDHLRCGDAFPRVQFKNVPQTEHNTNMIDRLKDRVLLNGTPGNSCKYQKRIAAHELAHIFVQDDPSHTCEGSACPPENLLSDRIYEQPSIGNPDPAGMELMDELEMGFSDYDRFPLDTTGDELTPSQCGRVLQTINHMLTSEL